MKTIIQGVNMESICKYEEREVFPFIFKRQDGVYVIQIEDLEHHESSFLDVEKVRKIMENAGKPITFKKAREKSQHGDSQSQKMMAFFKKQEIFKIFIGKPGKAIRKIPDDIAVNGELELKINLDCLNKLIVAIDAHNFATEVARDRESKRTDYMDDEVVLPEGKYFDDLSINGGSNE